MMGLISTLVTNPLTYILAFLVLGLLLKPKFWKRGCYIVSVVLLLLFTNASLLDYVSEKWYGKYDQPLPIGKTYEYGIVLGGYSNWDWKHERREFSEIADRLLEGVQLHAKGIVRKLVIASDGSVIQREGDAISGNPQGMKVYLMNMGIPSEDIIIEPKANNTHENATLTLELIGEELRNKPSVIITSSIHVPRSVLAFEQVGLHPDVYMTDLPTEIDKARFSILPRLSVIIGWRALLHEMVGYVAYKYMYE